MPTHRVLALAAALLLATPVSAQTGPPAPDLRPPALSAALEDAAIAAALDPWLAGLQRDGLFNGVLVVARDGREIFAGAYGPANRETNTAATADTTFNISSVGKMMTHAAIARLVQEGRLARTDTVGRWIPDYPQVATRAATIDQLISHRGGVADFFGPGFAEVPKDSLASNSDFFRLVSQRAPDFAPGERQEYCNGCYVVLGEIIARATGMSYEDYLAQAVLRPANMTRFSFMRPADGARMYGRPRGPQDELRDVGHWHGVAGSAAGGAFASARDLLAFDNALREHRLLNPEMTAWVLRGQPEQDRATSRIFYAGGSPGANSIVQGNGAWTVIALANLEPPAAEAVSGAVFPLLAGSRPQ